MVDIPPRQVNLTFLYMFPQIAQITQIRPLC